MNEQELLKKKDKTVRYKIIPVPLYTCGDCKKMIHIGTLWYRVFGQEYHLGCVPNN